MICYKHDGVTIYIEANHSEMSYRDHNDRVKSHFNRKISVEVKILGYELKDRDLTELCFVKEALRVFLESYWRKTSAKGLSKIDLNKRLSRGKDLDELHFIARQHKNQHYLEIYYLRRSGGHEDRVYLDFHSVKMLDAALNKTISMLSPELAFAKSRNLSVYDM